MTGIREFPPVTLRLTPPIAVIAMADLRARNVIRPALHQGLRQALATAVEDKETRAVVVTGMPEVFCAGAAREALLGIEGGLSHEDYEPFARSFPHCPLPVVAAMAGHAVGGGLVFGLYADVPVLSERSVYAANFLQYGMAPYVGTTHIIPSRFGEALGAEMILTARGYRGSELRARGASVLIVRHDRVVTTATTIAERIAQAPRRSLELVKAQLAERVLAATDAAMSTELRPHLAAAGLADVRERAATGYGPPMPASATHAGTAAP
jgi:polyketide biosynthesis enoyl-CoA hydratase PksI